MADKGFEIGGGLPILKGNLQFSLRDEAHTRRIASVPVHAERAIQRTNLL